MNRAARLKYFDGQGDVRNGQAFHQVYSKLLCHIRQDTFLLVERLLVSADQAALVVDLEPGQVVLLVDGQRPQQDVVGEVLGGRASGVEGKISVMEGIRRRLAVRISELARRCLIEDFVLLYVIGGDLDDFLAGLLCGCRAISLNFTHNARMAEIVRLYREQAPEEIDRIIDDCFDNKLTTLFAIDLLWSTCSTQSWNSSSESSLSTISSLSQCFSSIFQKKSCQTSNQGI